MTDRIQEIRARCEAATPGPWETALDVGKKYYIAPPSYGIRDFCYLSGGFDREQDASFIAHAREDIPYLLSQLAAKDAEIERLREAHWKNSANAGRVLTFTELMDVGLPHTVIATAVSNGAKRRGKRNG